MSCLWKLFTKQKPVKKEIDSNLRIINPLNLDELPDSVVELRAHEGAIIDQLISIHYQLQSVKQKLQSLMKHGSNESVRHLLGKKMMLIEKRKMLERRLQKIQEKLQSPQ